MERFIGIDVSATTCTIAVVGPSGKRLKSVVVETNGKALVEAVQLVPGRRHLCIEEGTQAEWLSEILTPHVDEMLVVSVRERRGSKSDEKDAFTLAEGLRVGAFTQNQVFKPNSAAFGPLREMARVHSKITRDVVRVKSRIKALFRSRGVATDGKSVYAAAHRETWVRKLPLRCRAAATLLLMELDAIEQLRDEAEKQLIEESRRHPITRTLESCPGIGPIRAAQLVAIVISPNRFRTKRQLWAYAGLGVITRSSSDWSKGGDGQWLRRAPTALGLSRDFNRTMKSIFKGAAHTVIVQRMMPLYGNYERLIVAKTKPDLAKLTLARKIAAIVLAMWKNAEEYDAGKQQLKT